MKFVVTKAPYGNDVEVKLHDDTKSKIKKVLYWGVIIPAGIAVNVKLWRHKKPETSDPTTE